MRPDRVFTYAAAIRLSASAPSGDTYYRTIFIISSGVWEKNIVAAGEQSRRLWLPFSARVWGGRRQWALWTGNKSARLPEGRRQG